jgi:hypothetical protein
MDNSSIAHPRKPGFASSVGTAEERQAPRARPLPAAAPGAIAPASHRSRFVAMRHANVGETTRPVSGLAGCVRMHVGRIAFPRDAVA